MENLTIRSVTENDAEDIARNLFSTATVEEVREYIKKDLVKIADGNYIRAVAVTEGKVVGQVSYKILSSPVKQHIVDIEGVVVAEDYQGKGIFRRLVDYGMDWATKKGVEIAVISVRKGVHAEDVYRHIGFTQYGELKNGIKEPWGDKKTFDEVFLYKRLVDSLT